MQTITCPYCSKSFEPTEAFESELKQHVTKELEKKHKDDIESARKSALEASEKRLREEFSLEAKRTSEDLQEKDKRIQKLIQEVTEITKSLREAKQEKEEAKLEMQKTLAQEEEKIRIDAGKKAEAAQHTILLAKDKQLQDTLKELEDAKRKLQQGSQQAQGEVFELEFEKTLSLQYPNDKITPVGKGVKGGDIIQEVWDRRGNFVGKILWELKNTKNWDEKWIEKLKANQREITAEEAVLISEVMPSDMNHAGFRNSVWVTQRDFVIPLCDTLRAKLIQLFYVRNTQVGKKEKMEILYTYLSGAEFKQRIEAIVESFSSMQQEIEKEKRYFSNKWARDEKHIRQVIDNTVGMHGDLRGIIGNSLPQIKELEVFELEGGE